VLHEATGLPSGGVGRHNEAGLTITADDVGTFVATGQGPSKGQSPNATLNTNTVLQPFVYTSESVQNITLYYTYGPGSLDDVKLEPHKEGGAVLEVLTP